MKIGSKIKHWRLARGLTAVELAAAAGCSQSTISDIEADKRSPSLNTLEDICIALKIPLSEILPTGEEKEATSEQLEMIELLYKMSPTERTYFLGLLKELLSNRKK